MIHTLIHACHKLSITHLLIAGLVAVEAFCHSVGVHTGLEGIIQFMCACSCHNVRELKK